MWEYEQSQQHPELFNRFEPPVSNNGCELQEQKAVETAWRLWEVMGEIFSNRWILKNGEEPSELWIAQIGSMSEAQITLVCLSSAWNVAPWAAHGRRILLSSLRWYLPAVLTRSI